MIYQFPKWRMISAALLAIFFLVVAGLALFYGRAVADGWIALINRSKKTLGYAIIGADFG